MMTNLISQTDNAIQAHILELFAPYFKLGPAVLLNDVEKYREAMDLLKPLKKPSGFAETEVASYDPAVELRPGLTAAIAVPKGEGPFPMLVHAHGHGLRAGHPDDYSPWIKEMASHGFVVMFPDYRLVPEHAYADLIDDMSFAVDWAQKNAASYKGDADRLIIGGDSAGAGLALDILVRQIQDPNGARFKAFLCVDGHITETPDGTSLLDLITPGLALPPTIMMTGSADHELQFNLSFAQALGRAGIHFEMHVIYGMMHDYLKIPKFDAMPRDNAFMMNWLKRAVG